MFTHQRIEEIQNKIKNSNLLSSQERADWLDLLVLMNDKQLRELEEILDKENLVPEPPQALPPLPPRQPIQASPPPSAAPLRPQGNTAPKPAPKPTPAPPPPPQPTPPKLAPISPPPPLKHIANIPHMGLQPRASGAPTSPAPKPAKPPTTTPPAASPAPTQPVAKPTAPLQSAGSTPYKLEHPEDLKALTARDLRNYDLQSLVNAIKNTIAEHGYFSILQLLEQSPLYESYIKSGEMKLKGLPADLNQSEFEFVTDLLIHMRFNKW